jgi:hypothetical protein
MTRKRQKEVVTHTSKRRRKDHLAQKQEDLRKYLIGPDHRMGHEGFLAGIGGWTGDLSKKGTWLAPATGTARNRPINDLLDWLNANVETERGKRLQALIHDLKQVESLSDIATAELLSRRVVPLSDHETETMKVMNLTHDRIEDACKRYCLYPRLDWTTWGKWSLSFFTEGETGELPIVYDGPNDYGRRVFEADAAIIVIGIAQRDEIARLRACEQCGSWFFASANTSHNARKFCNDSCRLKKFHSQRKTRHSGVTRKLSRKLPHKI